MDQVTLLLEWCEVLQKSIMYSPFLPSLFLILSLLYLLKIFRRDKLDLPPSPSRLPIIGNLHQLGLPLHRSLHALSQKYGHLMLLHFGQSPVIIVSSAEILQEIMKNHEVVFSCKSSTRAANVLFNGCTDLAFCPYGEYWRQVRKMCVVELLSQKRVQEFHFVREEETVKMVEKLRFSSLNGAAVNLSEMLLTIGNSIVSRSALGKLYEKQGNDKKSFGELTREASDLLGNFSFQDMFPSMGWMDNLTGLVERLEDASRALHDFLDQVIDEHEALMSNNDESAKKDMVDILLRLQMPGMNLTRDNLKAILLDMFIAGTSTTASIMEWAMAELVRHPRMMRKAQEEIRRVVGQKQKLNESDMKQMDYLKCILKETLRLHAPTMISRESSASVKLGGFDIPPKTKVLVNVWAVQMDPKVWDRPEEFIPERFANISVDFKGQHPQLIPFGWGRRVCPGISFGVAEAELVLANLLYWFDWELPHGGVAEELDLTELNGLVLHKKTPLLLVPLLRSP